ncbi:hypothetical protein [Paenibacillus sp. SN-8-1]|uniref:hypothetical protein n=1 Tax=Paenibacillus sp. SN-8-1 TaxID=3435409 RepID=UPI003D9A3678
MKTTSLLGMLVLIVFLAACGQEKKVETSYLEVKAYQGDRQEVLKVINKRVQYFNNRDEEQYPAVFTSSSSQNNIDAYKGDDTQITVLKNPKFLNESKDQIAVTVREEYKDSPYGSVGDTVYYLFKQDDGSWLINGLD